MIYLKHKKMMLYRSYRANDTGMNSAINDYWRQYRDDDGSIPWEMFYEDANGEEYQLNPKNGEILEQID